MRHVVLGLIGENCSIFLWLFQGFKDTNCGESKRALALGGVAALGEHQCALALPLIPHRRVPSRVSGPIDPVFSCTSWLLLPCFLAAASSPDSSNPSGKQGGWGLTSVGHIAMRQAKQGCFAVQLPCPALSALACQFARLGMTQRNHSRRHGSLLSAGNQGVHSSHQQEAGYPNVPLLHLPHLL